jgi:hypothetical protein
VVWRFLLRAEGSENICIDEIIGEICVSRGQAVRALQISDPTKTDGEIVIDESLSPLLESGALYMCIQGHIQLW